MKKLIHFFLENSLFVNLITVLVLAFGFLSLGNINKEGYPKVDRKMMYVTVVYPGASGEESEANITLPLEQALLPLEGVDKITSQSGENLSVLTVNLDIDHPDPESVKSEVRNTVLETELPDEAETPQFFDWKVSSFPVLMLGLFSESLTYGELKDISEDLSDYLLSLSDVSKVEPVVERNREIQIRLNLSKMNENYISIQEVISAVSNNNFKLTGGTYEDGNVDKAITVSSLLEGTDDLEKIVLREAFDADPIYLTDIAEIIDDFEEESSRLRLNGESGIAIHISKKENSDIINTVDSVLEAAETYIEGLDEDVSLSSLWDLSETTRERLEIVTNNAVMGLVLVIIILFIFMDIRNAFWTAMGIPFSIAFAMVFLQFFNVTINSVSLLGIIVVLGMVVDDAIVISENIYRHRIEGKGWVESAKIGVSEMAAPVFATILTTVVSFLSLYNLKGTMGQFSREIPIVVIFVLAGSLFESIFILPSHLSHRFKPQKEIKMKEKKFILKLRSGYEKLLFPFLKRPWWVIGGFSVLMVLTVLFLLSGGLPFISFPASDATALHITGNTAFTQNLDETESAVLPIEEILSGYGTNTIRSFSVTIGDVGYPEFFDIDIYLTSTEQREYSSAEIQTALQNFIDESAELTNVVILAETGGPVEGRALEIRITGNDNDLRRNLTDEIFDFLNQTEGVLDVTRSDEQNKLEISAEIDQNAAAWSGVSPLMIAYTLRAAMTGVVASTWKSPEDEIAFRVMLREEDAETLSDIKKLKVPNENFTLIPLSVLVDFEELPAVDKIDHFNGKRSTQIELDVEKDSITPIEVMALLEEEFSDFESDYPEFEINYGGEAEESAETISGMVNAGALALFVILMILIFQFKSVPQATMVLLAVPFSVIGMVLTLIAHGEVLSSMALFGEIGLIGVVVNDSLVMVEYLNSLRSKMTPDNFVSLIVKGAGTRLRPVILTTITTIAGLIPTAYGLGGTDNMIRPTTLVMGWGLLFATTLTLFLVPCFYAVEWKLSQKRAERRAK